jgi:hypothetical protein
VNPSEADCDRNLAIGLFLVSWVVSVYFWGGGGWAQNSHFALTRALVVERSVFIGSWADTTGDISVIGGRAVTNKAPGLSFLGVIPYAVARAVIPGEDEGIVVTLRAWLTNAFSNALLGALIAPLLFLYGRRSGLSRTSSLAAALALFLGTPLLPYATVFFLHTCSGALMLLAIVLVLQGARWSGLGAGVAAGAAALTNYLFLPGVPLLALFGAGYEGGRWTLTDGWWRRGARIAAGAAAPLAIFAVYQVAATGRLFDLPLNENAQFTTGSGLFGLIEAPSLAVLGAITISPYRGLFFLSPVLLLAGFGVVAMTRAREYALLALIAANVAVFFAFNVTFNGWEGGFGIGPRYLVPIVPLLGMLVVRGWSSIRLWLFAVLVAVSLANNVAATAVDPTPNASIPDPLREYVYPLLLTGTWQPTAPMHPLWRPELLDGHTSVSRHTIDEKLPFQKERPGSPPSEWAAFNLGEMVWGPGSAGSLIPLALLLAASCGGLAVLAARGDRLTRSSR